MTAKILDLPTTTTGLRSLGVGDQAVIERKGRPWKVMTVTTREPVTIEVAGKFWYCTRTGERLNPSNPYTPDVLVLATPERLAYLKIREFLEEKSSMRIEDMRPAELLQLLELIRSCLRSVPPWKSTRMELHSSQIVLFPLTPFGIQEFPQELLNAKPYDRQIRSVAGR